MDYGINPTRKDAMASMITQNDLKLKDIIAISEESTLCVSHDSANSRCFVRDVPQPLREIVLERDV
jgi:hypothetical protein